MPVSGRIVVVLAVVALGFAPARAPAQSLSPGSSFVQLAGDDGCLISEGAFDGLGNAPDCVNTPALMDPVAVVVSPDGAQVDVVGSGDQLSGTNGVTVFRRDAASGSLRFASCVSDNGGDGRVGSQGICGDGDALAGATGLAFSPDGAFAYVAARRSSAVSWFSRDAATGTLTQLGCIKYVLFPGERFVQGRALSGADAAVVSPDGAHVYVAAAQSGAVAVLRRDTITGALVQQSCFSDSGSDGACTRAPGLAGVDGLAIAADGRDLYAIARSTGALVTLGIDGASGDLAPKACLLAEAPRGGPCSATPVLRSAQDVAMTLDGTSLLVVAGESDALLIYRRNLQTGLLTRQQCLEHVDPQGDEAIDPEISEEPDLDAGCDGARALASPTAVAVSRDGRAVFTASPFSLAAFGRDPASGHLSQFGCIEADLSDKSCVDARGGSARALAASADGRNLYVASEDNALGVFAASVAIASARVSANRRGMVRVLLACPKARREGCSGRLRAGRAHARRAFHVAAGRTAHVRVALPRRVRRVLHRHRHARVLLKARDSRRPFGAASRRVTVRAAFR